MASPLNTFKTVTAEITESNSVIYSSPQNVTTIVLMAQATNVSNTVVDITFSHYNSNTSVETELVKDFSIPDHDASSLITGKLVIEENNSVKSFASANNTIKITMSILETLNA